MLQYSMYLKTCSRCNKPKALDNFHKKGTGLNARCKQCCSDVHKEWYEKSKDSRKKRVAANVKKLRKNKKAIIDEMKSKPCLDCGKSFPPCAMDYDHVSGNKEFNIGTAISNMGVSMERLLKEIEKCELVCANCHRIRTHLGK